jgi:hypothetical protein
VAINNNKNEKHVQKATCHFSEDGCFVNIARTEQAEKSNKDRE